MSLGKIATEADLERWLLNRFPALRQSRSDVLLWGEGAPSATPSVPRAVYVQLDGAAGSVLHVWDGAAWSNFA